MSGGNKKRKEVEDLSKKNAQLVDRIKQLEFERGNYWKRIRELENHNGFVVNASGELPSFNDPLDEIVYKLGLELPKEKEERSQVRVMLDGLVEAMSDPGQSDCSIHHINVFLASNNELNYLTALCILNLAVYRAGSFVNPGIPYAVIDSDHEIRIYDRDGGFYTWKPATSGDCIGILIKQMADNDYEFECRVTKEYTYARFSKTRSLWSPLQFHKEANYNVAICRAALMAIEYQQGKDELKCQTK